MSAIADWGSLSACESCGADGVVSPNLLCFVCMVSYGHVQGPGICLFGRRKLNEVYQMLW